MKRKVVQQGPSTLMISLPSHWVKEHHVKKGDELELIGDDQGLKISFVQKTLPTERVEYDLSDLGQFRLRTLGALYKSGYDEVYLRFDTMKDIENISEQMTDLMPGFEVMDQGKKYCLIKNIATSIESEFDTIVRRIFFVTISMAKTTLELIKAGDFAALKAIRNLETTNNKLCNFCERLLNKQGYKKPRKICFMYSIIWEIEKIGDEFKYLTDFLQHVHLQQTPTQQQSLKLDPKIIAILENACTMLTLFYETFYTFDKEKIAKIAHLRKEIVESSNKLFTIAKSSELKVVHHSINISQMVFNMQGCYLGLIA